jgi:predicted amidohydrolase
MKVRAAVVQPVTPLYPHEAQSLPDALRYIDQAADQGVQILCFPESYPGCWKMPIRYSPVPEVAARAKARGLYVICGDLEDARPERDGVYTLLVLIGPDGKVAGRYRRTSPIAPWMYPGGKFWDFPYLTGDELPVFDTDLGKVALLMCSDEICFLPAGAPKTTLWHTWRNLTWARASENLMYTATCQNLFGVEDGLAMICSPEEVLVESKKEGIFTADLDLERVRWLRNEWDISEYPRRWKTKPGIFKQWRRPELYRKNCEDW